MISQANEYATLREELLQAKRYVFERPLVIVALGIGVLTTLERQYAGALALVLAGLIVFNFRFTVNRLMSAARIVAYIQLALEEFESDNWIGWESSLRYYRKWLKRDPTRAKVVVDREIDKAAVPDSMMHYPPIYQLHIAIMIACCLTAIVLAVLSPSTVNIISITGVFCLSYIFIQDCRKYHPSVISTLIERNRTIWIHVFASMQEERQK